MIEDVRVGFRYNRWANRRLLAAVEHLTAEELDRDLRASFSSVRGTLRHMVGGERRWLQFWRDGTFSADLQPTDLPDLASIEAAWAVLEQEQAAFLEPLTDSDLVRSLTVRGTHYALGGLIHHLLNHSTYHRGQVALLLRQLGRTPPATDYRLFLTEGK